MSNQTELIVMLTYNDLTIPNAYEIFEQCQNSPVKYWGFKEEGLSLLDMKMLFSYMKQCGKTTFLEVVAYTEQECLDGVRMAIQCGCDYLMGTTYFESVNKLCQEFGIKYMPFVGQVSERPSILNGNIDDMIMEANQYLEKGVFGIDLLGYRYTGNPVVLNQTFVNNVGAPICIAGSINNLQKLHEMKKINPWAFTIGSAFFEHKFGCDIKTQIDKVYRYIKKA